MRRPLLTKSAGKIARFFRLSMNLKWLGMLGKMRVNLLSRIMAIRMLYRRFWRPCESHYISLGEFCGQAWYPSGPEITDFTKIAHTLRIIDLGFQK